VVSSGAGAVFVGGIFSVAVGGTGVSVGGCGVSDGAGTVSVGGFIGGVLVSVGTEPLVEVADGET